MTSLARSLAHRRVRACGLAFAILGSSAIALAQTAALPEPPTGYHWERAADIKGAFLVPDDWHFKAEKDKGTLAYFVSRENIDKAGVFRVGLTVNVMPRLKDRDAVEVAQAALGSMIEGKKRHECGDVDMPPFVGGGCVVEDATTMMRYQTMVNPKTNTLYLFIFEAPIGEWEKAAPIGGEMMSRMILDDDV